MGPRALAEIFLKGGGAKPLTPAKVDNFSVCRRKKSTLFWCAEGANETLRFLRRFRLNLTVFISSAESASKIFRVFRRRATYDVIFFKFPEAAMFGASRCVPYRRGGPDIESYYFCCVALHEQHWTSLKNEPGTCPSVVASGIRTPPSPPKAILSSLPQHRGNCRKLFSYSTV